MAQTKKRLTKQPLHVYSITLTKRDGSTLQDLSQDASDFIGRAVSISAVARALVRFAEKQSETWAREQLFSLIEEELGAGVLWGGKKQ
jgi:hypothetical protein